MYKNYFINCIQKLLSRIGYVVIRKKSLDILNVASRNSGFYNLLLATPAEYQLLLLDIFPKSKSQFLQDLFVLSQLRFKLGGYFIEFGATDGQNLSNTYILEKNYAWTGILAEPSKQFHENLRLNRPNSRIDERCVYSETGKTVLFSEVESTGLSQMMIYQGGDKLAYLRSQRNVYQVDTISLNDMLDFHQAPHVIDYLSIDVEGGEFDILSTIDYKKYKFLVISVEHNYSRMRQKIFNLLTSNGYKQVHKEISQVDDWYIYAN
jgi:FkbM family methyltransferase